MHIHQVNPYTKLLRESYRDNGMVRKLTLANVSGWNGADLNELLKLIDLQRQVRGTSRESQVNLQLSQLLADHAVEPWRLLQVLSSEERRLQARNLRKLKSY
jgi:hypothetical protein